MRETGAVGVSTGPRGSGGGGHAAQAVCLRQTLGARADSLRPGRRSTGTPTGLPGGATLTPIEAMNLLYQLKRKL